MNKKFTIKNYLFLFLFLLSFSGFSQTETDEVKINNRKNAVEQQQKPYVILISVDGFRDDYYEKFGTDFLLKMKTKGVSAKMIPSFPSVTFPNHYTLVTGMIPAHHGLVGNNMYNPKTKEFYSMRNKKAVQNADWYGGIPIWSLAESQQMLTACYYWPGSEAEIAGFFPSYYFPYAETKTIEERIQKVKDWLSLPEEERPHFITFYLPDVDQAGHKFGPDALETKFAVKFADATVEKLVEAVEETNLPVNYFFVSDHGMTTINRKEPLAVPDLNSDDIEVVVNGTYVSVFIEDENKIEKLFNNLKEEIPANKPYAVYLKNQVPKKYRFSTKEDKHHRIGDIVLIAEAPNYFSRYESIFMRGSHGYFPEDTPEMNTVFLAWGPDIKKNKEIQEFDNVHLYSLLAELLGLDYDHKIDGDKRLLPKVLNDYQKNKPVNSQESTGLRE